MVVLNAILTSFSVLTVMPVRQYGKTPHPFALSTVFFPVIGLFIGVILYFILVAGDRYFLPEELSAFLGLLFMVVFTGALHIDGLSDWVDGFFGGKSREQILSIMKDSQIGSFGAVALVLLMLGKWIILKEFAIRGTFEMVPVVVMFSRWSASALAALFSSARKGGTGNPFIENTRWYHLVGAVLLALVPGWFLQGFSGVLLFLLALIVVFCMGVYSYRKVGGITGDILGATIEISELSLLLAALFIPDNASLSRLFGA